MLRYFIYYFFYNIYYFIYIIYLYISTTRMFSDFFLENVE